MPDGRFHFVSPLAIKLSIMMAAPFAKSPNWAYHITSELGLVIEYPYSKPKTPNSLRWLLVILTVLLDKFLRKTCFSVSLC
jgi:hypothetical protein